MKIKFIILPIIGLLLQSNLNAQDEKIILGIESTIGVSDRIFQNDGTVPDIIQEIYSDLEKPKVSYEIGMSVEYKLSKKLSIQSGIKFSNWGYRTNKREFNWGFPDPELPQFMKQRTQNFYLKVPVMLNRYIELRNSIFFLKGGFSIDYNLSNRIKTKIYFQERVETTNLEQDLINYRHRKINITADLGLGWQKPVFKKYLLEVGPVFRMQTFGIVKSATLNRRLYVYGVSFGLKF